MNSLEARLAGSEFIKLFHARLEMIFELLHAIIHSLSV